MKHTFVFTEREQIKNGWLQIFCQFTTDGKKPIVKDYFFFLTRNHLKAIRFFMYRNVIFCEKAACRGKRMTQQQASTALF